MKTTTSRRLIAAAALALACALPMGAFAQAQEAAPAAAADAPPMPANPDAMMFNFQGVPLQAVLDYMSRAGGFVIEDGNVVQGTVNVVSHQPVNRDEAVALLHSVLYDKGYAAIRDGRNLKLVSIDDARYQTPILSGSDPALIPNNDQIVLQIMPVRNAAASTLIENIRPMLPASATITSNDATNTVIVNDTQRSIRRIAEIIQKLDQAVSEITQLRVFKLTYADSTDVAALLGTIYAANNTGGGGGGNRGGGGRGGRGGNQQQQFFQQVFGGGRGGGNAGSPAMAAASRVTAAADDRTNSVVVGASAALMPAIEALIEQLDQQSGALTMYRVFPLRHADATEMATQITSIFASINGQTATTNRGGRGGRGGGGFGQRGGGAAGSTRDVANSTVLAVADTRTNSVIVSAVEGVMDKVESIISELDQSDARSKSVYVIPIQSGDPEAITTMLQGMFSTGGGTGRATTRGAATTSRNTTARNTTTRQGGGAGGTGGTTGLGGRGG